MKPAAKPVVIEIASDVICPWCYIGKRRLEKALALVGGEVKPEIRWLPFQLNPEMPKQGIARAEYRKSKFGSLERAPEFADAVPDHPVTVRTQRERQLGHRRRRTRRHSRRRR